MGIKGTVRRATDGHIIHSNIDTDIIVSEEMPFGSVRKPEEMYLIIERFCLGRRRLELFGEDHNIRNGWVTLGLGLSSSNLDPLVSFPSLVHQPCTIRFDSINQAGLCRCNLNPGELPEPCALTMHHEI